MSSHQSEQNISDTIILLEQDEDPVVKDYKDSLTNFLKFNSEEQKVVNEEGCRTTAKRVSKRKRKPEESITLNIVTEVFLRVLYPISRCMTKSVAIGLVKPLKYSPNVILNHGSKMLVFSELAWESFMKHLYLIECYLTNNMIGRKTLIRLLECNIEIDITKHRGEPQVRFRDLTCHADKILLSKEEFFILSCATSPVTRYMRQLVFSSSVVKDYLLETTEQHADVQILHGPVDTSIFNRIPHEVEMWRRVSEYELTKKTKEDNLNQPIDIGEPVMKNTKE